MDLTPDASSGSSSTAPADASTGAEDDATETSVDGSDADPAPSTGVAEDDAGSTSGLADGTGDTSTGDDEGATDRCAGAPETFALDPGWVPTGLPDGGNDYGWSSSTAHAGGAPGEIGGAFQRSANATSYAVSVEARGAMDCIAASGRMVVTRQDPDFNGGAGFGHFSRSSGVFVGFQIVEGVDVSVRVFIRAGGLSTLAFQVDDPEVPRAWSYAYDPVAATMTLELEGLGSLVHELTPEESELIADLDAFGFRADAAPEPEASPGLLEVWIDEVAHTR